MAGFWFLLVLASIALGCFAFWIWMLVECATKEPDTGNSKICWVLIIVFAHFVGALIYYFARRSADRAPGADGAHRALYFFTLGVMISVSRSGAELSRTRCG
jgi:hypothetical protein